jgi:hypothetical protein
VLISRDTFLFTFTLFSHIYYGYGKVKKIKVRDHAKWWAGSILVIRRNMLAPYSRSEVGGTTYLEMPVQAYQTTR